MFLLGMVIGVFLGGGMVFAIFFWVMDDGVEG